MLYHTDVDAEERFVFPLTVRIFCLSRSDHTLAAGKEGLHMFKVIMFIDLSDQPLEGVDFQGVDSKLALIFPF